VQTRLAVRRVVVDFDLGIDGDPLARAGSHQGIDLGQRGVEVDEGLVKLEQDVGHAGIEPGAADEFGGLLGLQPTEDVHRLDQHALLRLVAGLFHVDPAAG